MAKDTSVTEAVMAYEDIYKGAAEAEQAALVAGSSAVEARAAYDRVTSANIRARHAHQDALLAKARAARLAADRFLYEGGRAADDAEYLAAKAIADALGDEARSI